MNPKGEEGEFYMKKSLLVLASIIILALCIFVACTSEVSDPYDGLTYVTFGGESPTSKNLLASYEVASYDSLYWFYTAEKKDNYGTSGAVENKPVHEGNTGLNNTVGPFSQGKWLFTLCAYKNNAVSEDAKVYEGSVEVSLKGQKVTVPVSVTPYGKTGALEFNGVYFSWKENAASSTAIPVITIVAEGTTTGQKYTLSNSFTASEGVGTNDVKIPLVVKGKEPDGKFYIDYKDAESSSVVADFYNCSIIAHIEIEGSQTPIFSQKLGFRVYGSTTTTISGDITEGEFTGVDFSIDNMAVIEMSGSSKASFSVTPSGMDGKTTDVDFSDSGLSGKHVLVVDVDSAVEASNFTIEGEKFDSTSQSVVARIGLELSSVSETTQTPVTSFGNNGKVVVTTYIAKGLENVTVKYNGTNGGDPTSYDYDSTTGMLSFTTTHFSEFYVVANKVEAINLDTNVAYKSFVEAVNAIVKEGSVSLLSDVSLGSIGNTNEKIYIGDESGDTKSVSIDLCGHDINLVDSSLALINVKVELLGEGTIRRTGNTGNSAIWLFGSKENVSDYTVLTIGKEVLIDAAYGVSVNKNPNASKNKEDSNYGRSCGVVVNLYGNINAKDCGLYVNGTCEFLDNAPVFNLNGITITVDGTTNASGELCGIYAAGYAIWNIKDNTIIKAHDTAIEIRAGELNIAGGTFTATADEFSCKANGNGETTVGAAIAVAQHNTKLPINVTISGGTFSGYHALSVMNPQNNEYDAIKEIEVNVSGETLNSTKEGVEDVNYSSEFIRIGEGSSFTIRARKDGDEGNVTSLPDGRFFSSLQGAVDGVKDGSTVSLTLLNDVYEGGSLIVEDGRNLNLTLDFNGKTYFAFAADDSQKFDNTNAFEFRKGNTINLKNGKLTSLQKLNVILIKNYSNLTLENFFIEGYRNTAEDPLFAASALTCCYGDTTITGESIILGKSGSDHAYKALDVCYSYSDEYKNGLTVTFDTSFSGTVSGAVYFRTENSHEFETGLKYNHSLSVDSLKKESFVNANFLLQDVRLNCSFNMDEGLAKKSLKSQAPTKVSDGRIVFDKDGCSVRNKTTDMVYTDDLRQAVFNAEDEDELILLRTCVLMGGYPVEVNSKKITIDLNGEKVEAGKEFNGTEGLIEVDGGTLIVNDSCPKGVNGSIDATTNENVEFAIYAVEDATIYINDGTIKGNVIAVGMDDGTSKITINGGSFSSDPKDYLADGLNATLNGGLWIVSKN